MAGADVLGAVRRFHLQMSAVDDPVVKGVFFDGDVLFAGQKLKIRPTLL